MIKRISAIAGAAALILLCGCAGGKVPPKPDDTPAGSVALSLWTYPIGGWGTAATVSNLLASFHREYPDIRVSVKTLNYETGDALVEDAIQNGTLPDLVLEGPERLVANWGARGYMADLSDLWEDDTAKEILPNVAVACHDKEGASFIYPMCMTTHCMAIDRDLFEEADAWQYVDEETHTWTTEGFFKAVAALKAHGMETVAAVYCGGQGGDQGTRALVNNLYSGTFMNADHTAYTLDSPENIRALEELQKTDGILFAQDMVGSDEIVKFCKGELAMAFCWNVSMEVRETINKSFDFDIFPMAFPSDDGTYDLQGGIWGFGIFQNGDEKKLEASKTFIRYMLQGEAHDSAVIASTYLPVRDIPDLYVNDKLMNEYSIFGKYLGDYYQVTPGWAAARTAWWEMLQRVGKGGSVKEAVAEFSQKVGAETKQGA